MFWLLFLRFMLVFSLLCGILLLPSFLVRAAVKVAAALILVPVSAAWRWRFVPDHKG
jgi:hypothetical protein